MNVENWTRQNESQRLQSRVVQRQAMSVEHESGVSAQMNVRSPGQVETGQQSPVDYSSVHSNDRSQFRVRLAAGIRQRSPQSKYYVSLVAFSSDVNKDWTCKDKDKDQAYKDKDLTHKDQDKDKDKDLNVVLTESVRTRTRTSLTVTYCKLQLNLQSLSSNNNEHKVKVHNI